MSTIKKSAFILTIIIASLSIFTSCDSDKIAESSLYVFNDKLMGQYIDSDSSLSEFSKLIDLTKTKGLLNSYGQYTCFIPNDKAMKLFYKLKGKTKLEDFSADTLKQIVYDHIINGAAISFVNFNNGRLYTPTMSDRFISISFPDTAIAAVNNSSNVLRKDIIVYNGVAHVIDKVLDPLRIGIAEAIQKDTSFSMFFEALVHTGLVDSLNKTIDESFKMTPDRAKELEDAVQGAVGSDRFAPYQRKYGYTVFLESNATLRKAGIHNLEELKAYAADVYDQVFPDSKSDKIATSRTNSLNRFIAYHIVNKELSASKLIKDYDTEHQFKTVDMDEYIEPMSPNTLIQVTINRALGLKGENLINFDSSTGDAIRLVPGNNDKDAGNGVFHEIDGILTYNKNINDILSSKRLRFDFASMFPELTNNNMRGRPSDNVGNLYRYAIPYNYMERMKCNDLVTIGYTTANDKLMNYEGDEFFIGVPSGKLYDFTITTPPVPAGTYEVRFGFQSNGRRGVAQFYVDGIPAGVPVNLNKTGDSPDIGYVLPGSNQEDLNGFENDKMMRNRGYMKGPNSFKSVVTTWYAGQSARYNAGNLRKILGIYNFDEAGHHKISVKGLSGGQFQIDFLEFIPTSIIEQEDTN